ERDNQERARPIAIAEEIVEAAGFGFRQPSKHLLDTILDRQLRGRQYHHWPSARSFEHTLEGGEQAEQIHFELRLVLLPCRPSHSLARPPELPTDQHFPSCTY